MVLFFESFPNSAYSVPMNSAFFALACFAKKTKSKAELHTSSNATLANSTREWGTLYMKVACKRPKREIPGHPPPFLSASLMHKPKREKDGPPSRPSGGRCRSPKTSIALSSGARGSGRTLHSLRDSREPVLRERRIQHSAFSPDGMDAEFFSWDVVALLQPIYR